MSSHRRTSGTTNRPLHVAAALIGAIALVLALAVTGSAAYADTDNPTGPGSSSTGSGAGSPAAGDDGSSAGSQGEPGAGGSGTGNVARPMALPQAAPLANPPAGTPVVGVTKTLTTPGPFNPGDSFTYLIQYQCSSLETACPGATLTDVIPPQVSFVSNTTTSTPSTINYDAPSHTLHVTFTSVVDTAGTQGLIAGTTGQFSVTVKFPAGTEDGTTAHNCAVIAATGAAGAQSCVDAKALTTPTYGVSLTKKYTSPYTGNAATSGVQGTSPTTTLDLSTTVGGNQPAASVTVVDPDPASATNPFDSFDLTGFPKLSLPTGVQADIQVKTTGSYSSITGSPFTNGQTPAVPGNAADVTGIQIIYTNSNGTPIAASTTLDVKAGVQLRTALRSDPGKNVPTGTIPNQALVTAAYSGAPSQTDTANAAYTVVQQTPGVTASKTIDPSSAQEKSGATVTMTAGGTNTGNLTASSMTVTDGGPGGTAWANTFTFTGFTALGSMPSGVTAKVEVYDSSASAWVTLGSNYANGATPKLSDASPAPSATDVTGVQWVYSGTILAGTAMTNSFTTTLNDSAVAGSIIGANCSTVLMVAGSGGALQQNACANFTVTAIMTSITASKSFKPTSGVSGTSPATTVSLSGTNTSNVPITAFQLVDPGTGSDASFDSFDFTGFGQITAPTGTTWHVEVYDGSAWKTVGTYAAGATPPNLDLPIVAAAVEGVRYTLQTGSIPAGASAISTTVGLQLRGTVRGTGTAIASGAVKNCVTATSGALNGSKCATYTVTKPNPGTGVGVSKSIDPNSVVQGSGATTTVTLKAGNSDANVPADTIVLEDSPATQTTNPNFWDAFTFAGFGSAKVPASTGGATTKLAVEYWDGSAWQPASDTTYSGSSSKTWTPSLPAGVANADVHGVRYTWTGTFPAKQTGFTAPFKATLNAATATATYKDCVNQTYSGMFISPAVASQACANVTVGAQTHTVDQSKSFNPATGTLNLVPPAMTTATLQVKNTSNVPVDSIVVTDPDTTTTAFNQFDLTGFDAVTLPSHVQVKIEANDGTWQTVGTYTQGQSVTTPTGITLANVTAVRLTFTGTTGHQIPANSSALSVGLDLALRATIRGTTDPVTTAAIQNCFTTASDTGVTFTGNPCATFTPAASSPGVAAGKTWIPASGVQDKLPSSTITIKGRNQGNTPVSSLVLQDPAYTGATPPAVSTTAFDEFTVTGLTGLVYPQGANQVQIDVLTASGTWHDGTPAATLPAGATVNGVALADIVGVRATFSNSSGTSLPVVTDTAKTGNVGLNVTLRSALRSTGAPFPVAPGASATVGNESSALVVYNGTPSTPATANANYTITSGAVKVAPSKTLYPAGSSSTVNPNQTLIYQLQIKNSGDRNLVAPVVLDQFDPTQLAYDSATPYPGGQFQFDANGSTLTGTGLSVDSSTSGQVKFAFAAGDYLAPGQTAYLRVVMTTQPGLPAGTQITNTYGITWDVPINGPISCTSGQNGDFSGAATWCTSSTTVTVQTADGMSSVKWIKGENDLGFTNVADPSNPSCPTTGSAPDLFTHYPCIAHTVTGGVFDYNLDMTVSGNVPMDRARAIDVLPHVGDTGVLLTGQGRNTDWTPTFYGAAPTVTGLPAGATYALYYSTSDTPSTAPLTSPAAGAWTDWTTTLPSDVSTIKAIGIDVETVAGAPLPPAATIQLHWQMKAPAVAPGVGVIAWNSFAFTGHPTDGSGWLLAAEPRKVGIDLAQPTVQVQKATTPAGEDGTFGFTLTPVTPAQGGGTATLTTKGGSGSTTPWTGLSPNGVYTLTETNGGDGPSFVAGTFQCIDTNHGGAKIATTDVAGGVQFTAPIDGEIVCSLTNTKRPSVTITKTAVGGDGTFPFTLTQVDPTTHEPAQGATPSTENLTTVGGTASFTWGPAGLTPGDSYQLVEGTGGDAPAYTVGAFQCTNQGAGGDIAVTAITRGAVFEAPAGAKIVCTVTNTHIPPPPPGTTTPPTTPPTVSGTSSSVPPTSPSVQVSGTSQTVGTSTAVVAPTTSTSPSIQVKGESKTGSMAYTGVNAVPMILAGLALLGGGAILIVAVRRRQPKRH